MPPALPALWAPVIKGIAFFSTAQEYTSERRRFEMAKRFSGVISIHAIIRRLLLSWLASITVTYAVIPSAQQQLHGTDALAQMWPPAAGILCAIFFIALWVLGRIKNTERAERWLFVPLFLVLSFFSLKSSFSLPFLIACMLILTALLYYAVMGWEHSKNVPVAVRQEKSLPFWLMIVAMAAFIIFVSIWTVCRVRNYSTPTYDFGIFSQMFYNMKTSGMPMTTVERDGLLSHFYVHVSPIYYLLLPFYYLIPTPATLQVLQAVVLASAVIPLWKLCQSHSFNGWVSLALCVLLLIYPAYSGGTSYDIHENAFLTPLILWLFYFLERRSISGTLLFTLLTLLVKEDAAVYTAVIGIYVFLNGILRKDKKRKWCILTGSSIFVLSVLYFLAVTGFLAKHGDGVMTYRYRNFMYDGTESLLSVVKAVLLCPMKAVFECVDQQKLSFIGLTMLPLLGIPLFTRRYERYILLIPYILINLMSDYQYQHSIFFQYTYGSTACLLYLTVLNLSDLKTDWSKGIIITVAIAISAVCFIQQVLPKASFHYKHYQNNKAHYQQIHDTLSSIPEDTAVSASTFYTTQLSQRTELYDVKYAVTEHILNTQYVALDPKSQTSYTPYAIDGENGYENLVTLLTENGFELWTHYDDAVVIYRKTE